MKKRFALALILMSLTASLIITIKPAYASSEDSWVSKAPMQQARSNLQVAVVNGKMYAIGGSITGSVVGTNEEYDPATDTWTYKTPMPTPNERFAIAVYQNKIYCISEVNEVYDPKTDTWENRTPLPTPILGSANVVNGKIYFLGAYTNGTLNQVYDPETDTWTYKASLPERPSGFSTVLDNKIYLIGGNFDNLTTEVHPTLTAIYNPSSDTWSYAAPPPTFFDSYGGYAVATTGMMAPKRIYVFDIPYYSDSSDPGNPHYRTQVYDPQSDSWTAGNSTGNRMGFAVGVLNDTFYAVGGVVRVGTSSYLEGFMPIYEYSAANQQYFPFGYGTPDPSYQTPAPSLSPSPSPTPSKPSMIVGLSESASALNYGSRINFTITVEGGRAPYTYAWYLDNSLVENSTSQYYATDNQPVGSHHVYVEVKDADGDSATTLTVEFNVLPATNSASPTQQPTSFAPRLDGDAADLTGFYIFVGILVLVIIIAIAAVVYCKKRRGWF